MITKAANVTSVRGYREGIPTLQREARESLKEKATEKGECPNLVDIWVKRALAEI